MVLIERFMICDISELLLPSFTHFRISTSRLVRAIRSCPLPLRLPARSAYRHHVCAQTACRIGTRARKVIFEALFGYGTFEAELELGDCRRRLALLDEILKHQHGHQPPVARPSRTRHRPFAERAPAR